jgi:hypothetical protein
MEHFDLDAAVRAGVIRSDQADELRRFDERLRHAPGATEEKFAFISGFADVMAAIGIGMVTITLVTLVGSIFPYAAAAFPFAAWVAARYFTEKRRLMLTSFLLFAIWAISCAGAALTLGLLTTGFDPLHMYGGLEAPAVAYVLVAGVATVACYAWWRRFQLPIAFAAFAVALVNVGVNAVRTLFPHFPSIGVDLIGAAVGPVLFVWAMWWDMSDVRRETIRSDVAFWMHIAAGFQMVKGAMTLLLGVKGDADSWGRMFRTIADPSHGQAAAVLLLFLIFATVALIIDRRSLLTSGMVYAVPAMIALFGGVGSGGSGIAAAFLVCGLLLTFLAVRWTAIREPLLRLLPDGVKAQLPRPQLKAVGPRPVY